MKGTGATTSPSSTSKRQARAVPWWRRGAFLGGTAALVVLLLWSLSLVGPLQARMTDFLFMLVLVGATLFPAAERPSPLVVPTFGSAAFVFAFAVFTAIGMAAGWIVELIWGIAARSRRKS